VHEKSAQTVPFHPQAALEALILHYSASIYEEHGPTGIHPPKVLAAPPVPATAATVQALVPKYVKQPE